MLVADVVCETEISEFHVTVLVQKNVLKLDVPVYDAKDFVQI